MVYLESEQVRAMVCGPGASYGNAAGALTITRLGAIGALPDASTVDAVLVEQGTAD